MTATPDMARLRNSWQRMWSGVGATGDGASTFTELVGRWQRSTLRCQRHKTSSCSYAILQSFRAFQVSVGNKGAVQSFECDSEACGAYMTHTRDEVVRLPKPHCWKVGPEVVRPIAG
jgi:hypothetical protein